MNLSSYLTKLRGTTRGRPPRVSNSEVVWSWVGAFIGIAVVSWLNSI